MYIAQADGKEGPYFFMRQGERIHEQAQKPSIKAQLAVKPGSSDKPTAKAKNREVR